MKHILPTELVNKILNFLAAKAYSEVAGLIKDIQSQAVQHVEEKDCCAKDESMSC